MKKTILLIDDDSKDLSLMKRTLEKEIKRFSLDEKVKIETYKICCDENILTQEDLDSLIGKIKELQSGSEKLVVFIDLNLVGDANNSTELNEFMQAGISVKKYIQSKLPMMQDENFIYMTRYSNSADKLKVDYILKPQVLRDKTGYVEEEGKKDVSKTCSLDMNENLQVIIKGYYSKGTTYGNFIGTILEKILRQERIN